MKTSLSALVLGVLVSVPSLAFAQQLTTLQGVINYAARLGNAIVPIIISVGVIYLVINIVRWFIIEPGEERTAALYQVLWAVLGLFLILSIWGLVNILRNSFSTNRTAPTSEFPTVFVPNIGSGGVTGGSNPLPVSGGNSNFQGAVDFNVPVNNPLNSGNQLLDS